MASRSPVDDVIEREVVLPHPIERVWAALTDPVELAQWFGDGAVVDLRPGGAVLFTWGDDRSAGVVEVVDEPHRFSFWWTAGLGDTLTEANRTLVEFTLEEVDLADTDVADASDLRGVGGSTGTEADVAPQRAGATRLRVEERGFARLADGAERHADNTEGWRHELTELAAHLDAASADARHRDVANRDAAAHDARDPDAGR
jgi:uncharacterized protein YndB with AHSA1/START domain